MSSIFISEELQERVKKFTDAGEWKCSWHWDRDPVKTWNPITLKGAKQMLADLGCNGSMDEEIEAARRHIVSRYKVAEELRGLIQRAEIVDIADTHQEGCCCDYCRAAGYVVGSEDIRRGRGEE